MHHFVCICPSVSSPHPVLVTGNKDKRKRVYVRDESQQVNQIGEFSIDPVLLLPLSSFTLLSKAVGYG
jgi:hypothetical protein